MNRPSVIYGLADPRNGEIRYVGKTTQSTEQRLSDHMRLADKRGQHSRNWLFKLKQLGLCPELFVIEYCTGESWREAEAHWIAYFRSLGARLTNQTDGGMGPSGVVRSPETLVRMAEAQRGKVLSVEHRGAISAGLIGRKMSAHAVEKTSEFHRGRKRSALTRANMSVARKANGTTPLQIQAIKQLHQKNTGAKRSDETKAKIAEGVRAARAKQKEAT